MKIYHSCGYFSKEYGDPCGPDDHANCESCMRYDLCKANFIRDHHYDPTQQGEYLTLEQLAEMKGQKVWVQSPEIPEYGRYAIVEDVDIEKKILWLENDFTCHEYGSVWVAYLPTDAG